MATKYGAYCGAQSAGKVTHRAWLSYSTSYTNTKYTVTVSSGVYMWNSEWNGVNTWCGLTGKSSVFKDVTYSGSNKHITFFSSKKYEYTRGHTNATKTINATSKLTNVDTASGGANVNGKVSTASISISVPAKPNYKVTYNANGGSGAPSAQTKWYGENLTISKTKPKRSGYSFKWWNTKADGTGTKYNAGATYKANSALTLYAIWGIANPPSVVDYEYNLSTNGDDIIKNFTDITCNVYVIYAYNSSRRPTTTVMQIAGQTSNTITNTGTLTISGTSFTTGDLGTHPIYLVTTDNMGAVNVEEIGEVRIVAPTWSREVEYNIADFPEIDGKGCAIIDSLEIYNYTTSSYDTVPATDLTLIDRGTSWAFNYVFDEKHVDDPTDDEPNTDVRISYKHLDANVTQDGSAFYTTSRNQNYSNGIYNVMFVGGVDNELWANYTSRVWWSKINDPLYFPDTNFIEVGSNDTSVQGLTKVDDYLAVIKQSKTTDTAIFLLYPTSFEEETTYAVKQGVQGVGALSRYSFNILGDETLFLSPKGVMAVVPQQDEGHKVQNRSYYVDKKLLEESGIENAYSFVFDGKYFLSIGNGHVYVLDGNQRNSWGNDRTYLVYECYYLDNIPATCFVKYKDELVFSNDVDVCIFNDNFIDAYDADGNEGVPVKAEWSTVFDDDGALHYYKTMQKKGNLISVLPMENEQPYKEVDVDVDTFYEDPTIYFRLINGEYVRCKPDSLFILNETYYVESMSATKVYVRKDDKDPVEIERNFGTVSGIPSEMFLNKKFKKYKRLQFIIKNEEDEDFGIDTIVKNYTIGNYAKK